MNVLEVHDFSKTFMVCNTPSEWLMRWLTLGRGKYGQKITVIEGVNFALEPGEAMLVRGPNGSGKSTLLKAICGALTPTTGRIHINGRLGAIIELGIGLENEATGRENACGYYSRLVDPEISEKEFVERVCCFADLQASFDHHLKHYSSGMVSRLAFAGSVAVRPDLLVIDEALSVGDQEFQKKCLMKIRDFLSQGTALIFVSHADTNLDIFTKKSRIEDGRLLFENGAPSAI